MKTTINFNSDGKKIEDTGVRCGVRWCDPYVKQAMETLFNISETEQLDGISFDEHSIQAHISYKKK
jgi:hypothetical protein